MNSYISVPLVKDEKIIYKKIPIPKNNAEFEKILKNVDVDLLMNQMDNISISNNIECLKKD